MSASPASILVIADEPDIRIYLLNLLHANGYAASAVAGRAEGLPLIRSRHFSVVVLDAMLPGDEAQQICMELGEDEPSDRIPVVLLSPLSRRALRGSYICSGGGGHARRREPDALLTKPPEAEDFLAAVRRLTGNAGISGNREGQ